MNSLKHIVIFVLVCACTYACKTTESGARDYFTRNPSHFADLSAKFFPPGTKYIPGDPILMPGDTVLIAGDSIPCPEKKEGDMALVKVKCPDSKFVHDTVFRIDTIQVENTAKIESQAIELIAVNHENERLSGVINDMKRQRWYIFALGLLSPFIAYGAFKLATKLFL